MRLAMMKNAREDFDAVDDPRTRPIEVRRAIHGPGSVMREGARRELPQLCIETRGLSNRCIETVAAGHHDQYVRIEAG
jgi:hypothetical protein